MVEFEIKVKKDNYPIIRGKPYTWFVFARLDRGFMVPDKLELIQSGMASSVEDAQSLAEDAADSWRDKKIVDVNRKCVTYKYEN